MAALGTPLHVQENKASSSKLSAEFAPPKSRRELAMERLVTVVQELSLARDVSTIQSIVRRAARELTGADGAAFVLKDGNCCYYADEDAISPLWKGQRFPMSCCISGWVMLNRQSTTIEDIYVDSRIPADAYRPTFVKSLLMVPIRREAPIGAIGNYWAHHHKATLEEIELLQALADTTAVALENVQVYAELEQRVKDRTRLLEETNRELETFSFSVSHDLRAPLRGIRGYTAMLEEALGPDARSEMHDYCSRITAATERTNELIDDLLRLAQVARAELRQQAIDLSDLVTKILADLINAEPNRSVETIVPEGIWAKGDAGLIRAALENLLSNAWKYTGNTASAKIEFGVEKQADGTHAFFVRDNGDGFDMKYAERLFAPFQRLHTAKEFAGNGVGLATVQRIIHKHGGRIWPHAEKGRGATFYFTLPAATRC